MATFPSYVRLIASGLGEEPDPSAERTEMERGIPKQAIVNSQTLVDLGITMLFRSAAEMEAFELWWRNDIRRIGWFTMTNPRTRQPIQARFKGGAIGRLQPTNPMFSEGTRQATVEFMR